MCARLSEREGDSLFEAEDFEAFARDEDVVFVLAEMDGEAIGYVLGSIHPPQRLEATIRDFRFGKHLGRRTWRSLAEFFCGMCHEKGAEVILAGVEPERSISTLPYQSSHTVMVRLDDTHWFEATGSVWLWVQGGHLKCFADVCFKSLMRMIDTRICKEVEVLFSVLDFGMDVTRDRKKRITSTPVKGGPWRHEIVGEVIKRFADRTYSLTVDNETDVETVVRTYVIDCGVPLHVKHSFSVENLDKASEFREGDWVKTAGRMNAYFEMISKTIERGP